VLPDTKQTCLMSILTILYVYLFLNVTLKQKITYISKNQNHNEVSHWLVQMLDIMSDEKK
jgi:hypothetical protein